MRSFTILIGLILVLSFSVFAQNGKIEILETGAFHGEEVSAKTGETWLGLFKQGGNYSLLPVVITVENVHDPISDNDESEKTGKEIKVLGQENAVFLIRGKGFGQYRPVKTIFNSDTNIESDFDETYQFGGKKYNLRVETERKDNENPKLLNETSKLILTEGKSSQIIYSVEECDDCSWQIKWAGDLDNDGKLDFYLQLNDHYNVASMKIFLSSEAENGKLVKEVAEFTITGC